MRIHYYMLKEKITTRLISSGMNSSNAEIEADIMLESDLLGVASHGVRMLVKLALGYARENPYLKIGVSMLKVIPLKMQKKFWRAQCYQWENTKVQVLQ